MKPNKDHGPRLKRLPSAPRAKRYPYVLAVRFGLEANGEDYGAVVEAASILGVKPAELVREATLTYALKLLRARRAKSA